MCVAGAAGVALILVEFLEWGNAETFYSAKLWGFNDLLVGFGWYSPLWNLLGASFDFDGLGMIRFGAPFVAVGSLGAGAVALLMALKRNKAAAWVGLATTGTLAIGVAVFSIGVHQFLASFHKMFMTTGPGADASPETISLLGGYGFSAGMYLGVLAVLLSGTATFLAFASRDVVPGRGSALMPWTAGGMPAAYPGMPPGVMLWVPPGAAMPYDPRDARYQLPRNQYSTATARQAPLPPPRRTPRSPAPLMLGSGTTAQPAAQANGKARATTTAGAARRVNGSTAAGVKIGPAGSRAPARNGAAPRASLYRPTPSPTSRPIRR